MNTAAPPLPRAMPEELRVVVLAASGGAAASSPAVEVARRLAASPGVAAVEVFPLPPASGASVDPFGLRARILDTEADAVLVVAPRRWGPHRVIPAPAIDERAVALVQADGRADLPAPGTGVDAGAPWVVAAMAKDVFLIPSGAWAQTLLRGGRHVLDLRADRARREDLLAAMALGPAVVIYAGHGRTRGWGGYQGLRWAHVEPQPGQSYRAAGLVIAFACDTLKRTRSGVPFGSRMVGGNIARAYLGAIGPIRTTDAEALGEIAVRLLADESHPSVAHLITSIDRCVRGTGGAARAWRQFRLLGDPTGLVAA